MKIVNSRSPQVETLAEAARSEQPPNIVLIESCGELPAGFGHRSVAVVSAAGWPLYAEDQGPPPEGVREAQFRLEIAAHLKQLGNEAYKQGDAGTALARYQQAIRYLSWTTFKIRTPDGEVDCDIQESRTIWDTETLLMGNIAAAHLKLCQYRAAADTCKELLHRDPAHVKGLLRAAQAHAGIGPTEYDTAAGYLKKALGKASEQQLPTREIVAEMHRLRDLQRKHLANQKARFSAGFAKGVLHQPADDMPSSTAADVAAEEYATGQFQHRIADQLLGRRVAGPVSAERVLENNQPVVVDDAWGTHPLVADDGSESNEWNDSDDMQGSVSSYSRGLMERYGQMGFDNGNGNGNAANQTVHNRSIDPAGHYSGSDTAEETTAAESDEGGAEQSCVPTDASLSGWEIIEPADTEASEDVNSAATGNISVPATAWHLQHAAESSRSRENSSGSNGAGGYGVGAMRALPQQGLGPNAKPAVP